MRNGADDPANQPSAEGLEHGHTFQVGKHMFWVKQEQHGERGCVALIVWLANMLKTCPGDTKKHQWTLKGTASELGDVERVLRRAGRDGATEPLSIVRRDPCAPLRPDNATVLPTSAARRRAASAAELWCSTPCPTTRSNRCRRLGIRD